MPKNEKYYIIKVAVLPFVAKILAAELAIAPTIKEGTLIGGALQHLPFAYAPELFAPEIVETNDMDSVTLLSETIKTKRFVLLSLRLSDHLNRHYRRWKSAEAHSLGEFFTAQARDRIYTYIDAAESFGVSRPKAIESFYKKYDIKEDDLPQDSLLRQYVRRLDKLKNLPKLTTE